MGVKFKSASNGVIIFEIDHNNGEKTLRQNLEIRPDKPMKWAAAMNFDGFPACDTPHDAALLLATWMERMASEIMKHRNFNRIDLSEMHPDLEEE